ncbi:hypothetical protein D3C78_1398950 [compost metagenome]
MVLPSGAALLTASAAMVPPPPAMLVTTMVLPVTLVKYLAIIRALKSVSPPALAITTTRTGRLGQSLASAAIAEPAVRLRNEAIKEAQSVFFIIVLRVLPLIGELKLNEKRTRPVVTPDGTGESAWVWKARRSVVAASPLGTLWMRKKVSGARR